jgi:hypothetical protein
MLYRSARHAEEERLVASIRVAGSIRDWFNARDVRRMMCRHVFPDAIVRHYIDDAQPTAVRSCVDHR